MRVGGRRLPLLIASIVLAWAPTAGAAEGGGFGVRDNVVDVVATSGAPGSSGEGGGGGGGGPNPCVWRVVIADDASRGLFGPTGERLYSDTGRWLQYECNGQPQAVGGQFLVPEGGAFAIADLLDEAYNALDPAAPAWSASPNGTTVPMVTQMPTWLWIDDTYWGGAFSARASTPSGRVWAEARATPTATVWSPGDGTTVRCGAGYAWQPGARDGATSCSHTFKHSSAGRDGFPLTVTVSFEVQGITSLGTSVPLGPLSRTSAPVAVQVTEIQAIETTGRGGLT